jgi:glycosyltransferase involved in cell wall biosynthesis
MTFVIISHVPHILEQNQYFGYAPYVREMNSWIKHANKLIIVAPLLKNAKSTIDIKYEHENIEFNAVQGFDILSLKAILLSIYKMPRIIYRIYSAMKQADHIHLRCPGNIGLLGCLVQILFPNKQKTAKYAGNWDPKSKQPLTYKLQKYILRSTFLTKNMQVLVYGEWEGSTKNIKPFFTASYYESNKIPFDFIKKHNELITIKRVTSFLFVGTLTKGKQPLYAVQLIEQLQYKGNKVHLDVFGEGNERSKLEEYILKNDLKNCITLHGNKTADEVQKAYQESSFLILPSKSEGWPKVIAEAMFWGCLPIASAVSCVSFMLDSGNRGLLLTLDLEKDFLQIEALIKNETRFIEMSTKASDWSRKYTIDVFEEEIKKLLKS